MTSLERTKRGNALAITTQAQGLPQMNGAGMVRGMRAAASLSGFAARQKFAFSEQLWYLSLRYA